MAEPLVHAVPDVVSCDPPHPVHLAQYFNSILHTSNLTPIKDIPPSLPLVIDS